MADNGYNSNGISLIKGMNKDVEPSFQPENTYRHCLNGTVTSDNDNCIYLTNELGHKIRKSFDKEIEILGSVYIGDGNTILFLINTDTNQSAIFRFNKNDSSEYIIDFCDELNFDRNHRINAEFRIVHGCERVIYFTDNYNKPRTLNIDKLHRYFNNSGVLLPEKLNLIRDTNIPIIHTTVKDDQGILKIGSYNFAIQYLDADFNPTHWITITQPVNVYNDRFVKDYEYIVGNANITDDDKDDVYKLFGIKSTLKAIELQIHHNNNNDNFPYFSIACITATNNTGIVTEVFKSPPISINDIYSTYIVTGNFEGWEVITKEEIFYDKPDIAKVKFIHQFDNRLILANGRGKEIDWCSLQPYASKIRSEYVVKSIESYNLDEKPNPKSNTEAVITGFMGGEVYAFGIVYIYKDGTLSPVYHIPGRPSGTSFPNQMDYYEVVNNTYDDRPNITAEEYWGKDFQGNYLAGNKIRHHKFPDRNEVPLVEQPYEKYEKIVKFGLDIGWETDPSFTSSMFPLTINIDYCLSVDNSPSCTDEEHKNVTKTLSFKWDNYTTTGSSLLGCDYGTEKTIIIDASNIHKGIEINSIEIKDKDGNNINNYEYNGRLIFSRRYVKSRKINVLGIKFSNIELPENTIGYYIVMGERDSVNRRIYDKGIANHLIDGNDIGEPSDNKYIIHAYYDNHHTAHTLKSDMIYVKNPKSLYLKDNFSASQIEVEGAYMIRESGSYANAYSVIYGNTAQDDAFPGSSSKGFFFGLVGRDKDGMNWNCIYRDIELKYVRRQDVTTSWNSHFTNIERSDYLTQGQKIQNYDDSGKILVNTELDSQVVVCKTEDNFYGADGYYNTYYVSLLTGNKDIHPNLDAIKYRFTTPKIQIGLTSENIFDGDIYISKMPTTHSTFYKTDIPRRLGETISNIFSLAIIFSAAVIITYFTAGTATPLAIAILSTLTASFLTGVSFEVLSEIIQDLESGALKDYLKDWEFEYNCNITPTDLKKDDTLVYCAENLNSIFVESEINIDLSLKLNTNNLTSYNNSLIFDGFPKYLRNKYLFYDEQRLNDENDDGSENEEGLSLKLIPDTEVYVVNLDYSRKPLEKVFFPIPITYDCKSKCLEVWENRVLWSVRSLTEEKSDAYRIFLPNNYRDLTTNYGKITGISSLINKFYIFFERMLSVLPVKYQEQLGTDLNIYIGTGEFFSLDIANIVDDKIGNTGTAFSNSITKIPNAIVYVSNTNKSVLMITRDGIKNLSDIGMSKWFRNHLDFEIENYDKNFNLQDIINSEYGIGYVLEYDNFYKRILLTKIDYDLDYESSETHYPIFDTSQRIWIFSDTFEPVPTYNKSYTLSFSLITNTWTSFHTYLPYYYFRDENAIYLIQKDVFFSQEQSLIKEMNIKNTFGKYNENSETFPLIIDFIINNSLFQEYTAEYLIFKTKSLIYQSDYNENFNNDFFSKIIFYNSRQLSDEKDIILRDKNDSQWLSNTVSNNVLEVFSKENDKKFYINEIRDFVINYSTNLFYTNNFSDNNNNYYGNFVNLSAINTNKSWNELQVLKDNYLGIIATYENKENVNFKIYGIILIDNKSNI